MMVQSAPHWTIQTILLTGEDKMDLFQFVDVIDCTCVGKQTFFSCEHNYAYNVCTDFSLLIYRVRTV
jgi:hypothetical protein